MKVKDLIWELQQIYNKDKTIYFGTSNRNEVGIHKVSEKEFSVYLNGGGGG